MIPVGMPCTGNEEVEAVARVIRSGMLAQGPRVEEFERSFARYCSTAHGVAVNSGTAALHATLAGLGIGPGEEVIVPAFTFFATASSVCMCGARPVFVDVDEETFNLSVEGVQEAITQRTRGVIGVHLFGQPFAVRPILEICEERGIPLVEDAAQAHGATYHGRKAGALAHAACFSFYPTKNMTTGEGGMVTTDDPSLVQRIRMVINHGQEQKYLHTCLGYNFRMTDLSAAIGLAQLAKLEGFNTRRRDTAAFYDARIASEGVITPVIAPGVLHVYHQYVVKVTPECPLSRDQLAILLREKGVGTAVHYPVPLNRQPLFREIARSTSCPVAEALAGMVLSLPVHPGVTDEDRQYIASCISEVT